MKINVVYNKIIPDYKNTLDIIINTLETARVDYKSFDLSEMDNYGEFTFVVGGDGTLLRAARFYAKTSIPVLGINLGRLGFLSQAGSNEFASVIEAVLKGAYYTEDRLMLSSGELVALNDFVIKGCNPSRTSKFSLEINDKYVCDYIADGIIIATPTGSTAYGLSAGGPILYPNLEALVVVPICPHSLNVRPLVVPSGEKITVKTCNRLLSVAIDGYDTKECIDKIIIQASQYKAKLAFLKNDRFYHVLRDKLHWGLAPGTT